ncbi:hypothetical protein K4K52_008867 [Colletotrichum sp. SAR 10_76]|nr:hypothetical protein K4K52_008867 [Colletotrichum sp. SAR 10_76]
MQGLMASNLSRAIEIRETNGFGVYEMHSPDVASSKICLLTIRTVSQTNLSAVVTKRLEESYNEDSEAVASIFIGADVTSSGTAFVEDVLTSVFLQLSAKYADVDGDMANAKYQLYLEAWKHGHRDRHRIRLVREALCLRLDMLESKFLIIDDFDRCYPAVDLFLEDELSHLAARGLRVFITSRISCLEEFPLSATGDSENFVQPYGHIDLNLNDNGRVDQFINHDLETQHGDLGLGSSTPEKLPPHSRLGRQLAATENRIALTELQGKVVRQAERNVSLARLRLDNEHQAQSAESVFSPLADVLPVNIVGFFRAGMRRVEEQPPERRDLGFKVIAAVTQYNYGVGIPYEALDKLLRNPTKTSARQQPLRTQSAPVVSGVKRKAGPDPAPTHVPHRSLEEMLHAACGFVVMVPLGNRPLRAYSEAFHEYARHYHEDLRWAHAQLNFDSVRVDEQGNVAEQGNLVAFGDEGMKRRGTFQLAKSGREDQTSDQNMKPFIPQKSDGGSRSSALKRQEFRRLRGAEFKLPVIPVSSPINNFTKSASPNLGFIPNENNLGAGTDSEESVTQMAEWVSRCANDHPNCKRRHGSLDFIPTRVLDVGTENTWPPKHVKLVDTKEMGVKGPYMTLSHCWGKGKFVQLTEKNLEEFTTTGIPWETLPHGKDICSNVNFAEALKITWLLKQRYIWIDSVCIIQDSKDDWNVESKLMHKFGHQQIFWDCATKSACEILPDGLPASLDTRAGVDRYWRQRLQDAAITVRPLVDISEGSLEKFWESAVRTYTACNLTKSSDRNPAIWGVAKLVRDALGEEYAYGLWSTRIEEQLAWRVTDPGISSYPDVSNEAPSWSWTRLQGTIQIPPRVHDPPRFYKVMNHQGGNLEFQFEKAVWGRIEGEHKRIWREETKNMDAKLKLAVSKAKRFHGHAPKTESPSRGDKPNLDEASALRSKAIALRGHICRGNVRAVPKGGQWEFTIGEPEGDSLLFPSSGGFEALYR